MRHLTPTSGIIIRGIGFSGDGLICLCSIVGTSENFQDPPCVFEPGGTTFFSARDGAREDSRVLVSGVNETRFEDSAVAGLSTTTSSSFFGVKKFARALILLGFGGDGFFCFFGGGSPAGRRGFFSKAFAAFSSIRAIRCNRFSSGVSCSSPAFAFSVEVSPVFSLKAFAAAVGSPPTVGFVTVKTSEGTPEKVRLLALDPFLDRCRDFTLIVSIADRTERPFAIVSSVVSLCRASIKRPEPPRLGTAIVVPFWSFTPPSSVLPGVRALGSARSMAQYSSRSFFSSSFQPLTQSGLSRCFQRSLGLVTGVVGMASSAIVLWCAARWTL